VSLALFRDRIEAGEVDETVRSHLRGCDECRGLYDQLALAARALGDDGAAKERERLMNALPLPAKRGEGRGEGAPRWAILAVAALLLAVVAILVTRKPTDDITMRGGNPDTAPNFSLRVYGRDSPGEKVRLIADFPGSKEASVGMRAELQLFAELKVGQSLAVELKSPQKTLSFDSGPAKEQLVPVGSPFLVGVFGPGSVDVCTSLDRGPKHCSTLLVNP
jgi:hypothetical protein